MAIYNVDDFTFDTEEEAKRAKQELQLIENLKNKTNINSPVIAKQLLDRCKAAGTFKTKVGTEFLSELQQTADISDNNKVNDKNSNEILSVSNNENTKNYINNKTNDKDIENTSSSASNKVYPKNYINNNINDNTRKILKQNKNYSPPLASGSLWSKIFIFVLPLLAINILKSLFFYSVNLDYIKFLDFRNIDIINLIVTLFMSLSIGINIIISYYIGKNNIQKVKKAVYTSILLVIMSSIIITFICLIFSNQISDSLIKKSGNDVFNICLLSIPFQAFYYCGAAIMFSKGDTKKPAICILISGIINVFLSMVFVEDLKIELDWIALPILISQIINAGLMTYFLVNEKGVLKLDLRKFSLDKKILVNIDREILSKILKIGIPIVLQNIIIWISIHIRNGVYFPITITDSDSIYYGFFMASATFISQNYGANKPKRCSKTIKICLILGELFSVIMLSILYLIFPNFICYVDEIIWYILSLVIVVFSGSMCGYGYSLIPVMISVIGMCVTWIYPIWIIISLIITAIAIILAYFVVKHRIKSKGIN